MRVLYIHEFGGPSTKLLALHEAFGAENVFDPDLHYTFGDQRLNPVTLWRAVFLARRHYRKCRPDVVVGCSLGGWVAMQVVGPDDRLVLVAPAWKKQTHVAFVRRYVSSRYNRLIGNVIGLGARVVLPQISPKVPRRTIILHSPDDRRIPIADSRELIAANNLPPSQLIEVGRDHGMNEPAALAALVAAVAGETNPVSASSPELS